MNCALIKLGFGGLMLCGLAFAQVVTAPSPNAMVSAPSTDTAIKPAQVTPTEDPEPDILADPASLLPDLPAVPRAKASLLGGTVEKLDRVRDQVTVRAFGGGKTKVLFDPRTRIYRGPSEVTLADLHEGDRIYIDTILDGDKVFAKNIRLKAAKSIGETQGEVLKYQFDRGEVTIRDAISPTPILVHVDANTRLTQGDQTVAARILTPGSLVSVRFSRAGSGHDVASEISILALPGTQYTFAGQVMHLDLRSGLLVVNSSTDRKTYEIYLDPSKPADENLHAGSNVTVVTNFEGSRYVARSVTIDSQPLSQ
jgi:hypothetical protein